MGVDVTDATHGSPDGLRALGAGHQGYETDGPVVGMLETIPWAPDDGETTVETVVEIRVPEFTSMCPRTRQPDFAEIVVEYVPGSLLVESKSLKLYAVAYRNAGIFHEVIVDRWCRDLATVLQPRWLRVSGRFRPRGGIAINPVSTYKGDT